MTSKKERDKKNNFKNLSIKVENLHEANKNKGGSNIRLQLGILLPCEARRTADQVPKNGYMES
jgi:hypothetical protein